MPKDSPSPATRKDLQDLQRRLDARMHQMEERIMARFDVLMENLVHDFRGAHSDKIALQEDKLQKHDSRLFRLERQAGLDTA